MSCNNCKTQYELEYYSACKNCLGTPQNIYFCWKFEQIIENSLTYTDLKANKNYLVAIKTEDQIVCFKFMDILLDYQCCIQENKKTFSRTSPDFVGKCVQLKNNSMLEFFSKNNIKDLKKLSKEVEIFFEENKLKIESYKFSSKALSTKQVINQQESIIDNKPLFNQIKPQVILYIPLLFK